MRHFMQGVYFSLFLACVAAAILSASLTIYLVTHGEVLWGLPGFVFCPAFLGLASYAFEKGVDS